jgi:hypothetical protein
MACDLLLQMRDGTANRSFDMSTLHSLRHVAMAVRHGEILADEADDLFEHDLARRLRGRAAAIASDVEDAVAAFDLIAPMKQARLRAHAALEAMYQEITVRLARVLSPDELSRLSPGGYLDVVERTRFRMRRFAFDTREPVVLPRADLGAALAEYDDAVDGYLVACADAQGKKDRAVVRSQALRVELEAAKARLLVKADVDSDAWKRIKRRAVRTKRARWLDETRARQLLADTAPVSAAPAVLLVEADDSAE